MKKILIIFQILISTLLIFFILLQQRGGTLSLIFGSGFYGKRRGVERKIFFATIFLAVLFVILAFLNLVE